MIIITGGAGFIGSNLVEFFSEKLKKQVCIIDYFNKQNIKNINKRKNLIKIHPLEIKNFLNKITDEVEIVIHMGAITSTTESDPELIIKNNIDLSIFLWNWCTKNKRRFLYASSAATYGDGENDFEDNQSPLYLNKLIPLNLYGWSKHIIDKYFIKQIKNKSFPPQWVGLKFFNVYGPNEYHKHEMKSIICKIFEKIQNNEEINLFKSHNLAYQDGEQLRDFVYVKDIVRVVNWFENNKDISGIFNVGYGEARSFNDLASAIFKYTNKEKRIRYIDTPLSIRKNYQYYTKANIDRLREVGYKKKFFSLKEGISDYITNFLRVP